MYSSFKIKEWKFYISLFFLVLTIKICFYNFLPQHTTPDSITYLNVAKNISQNHCVSISNPELGHCVPDWGGNQLLGYPLYLSLFNTDTNNFSPAILSQYILISFSIFYLCHTIYKYILPRKKLIIFIGIVLSLSPIQIGWSRSILTEAIVIPLLYIFFSEVVKSVKNKDISVVNWSSLLVVALFVRYELAFLCVAVPIICVHIYPWRVAVKKTITIAFFVSLPLVIWITRSYSMGLTFPPELKTAQSSITYPTGTALWFKTWANSSRDNPTFIWKVLGGKYSEISLSDKAFYNNEEKKQIITLVNILKKSDDKSIPYDIDNKFMSIAHERIERDPLQFWFKLPLTRIISMFTDVLYSNNLPIILSQKDGIELMDRVASINSISSIFSIIYDYPENTAVRAFLCSYKIMIYIVFMYTLFLIKAISKENRIYIYISMLISISSLLFTATFGISTETRYLLMTMLSMELSMVIILFNSPSLIIKTNK